MSSALFSAIMSIVQWTGGATPLSEVAQVTYRPLLRRNLCGIIGVELAGFGRCPLNAGGALLAERGEVVLRIIGECRTVADPCREDVQ